MEVFAIGVSLVVYHMEVCARKFAGYASRMISYVGDVVRPNLKSFYECPFNMSGLEDISKDMEQYKIN